MIFVAVICGVFSAGYMYESVIKIFMPGLRKALRLIALGLTCFTFGVLLASLLVYSPELGVAISVSPYANLLSAVFYLIYILGSLLVFLGSRQFNARPARGVVDVSLNKLA